MDQEEGRAKVFYTIFGLFLVQALSFSLPKETLDNDDALPGQGRPEVTGAVSGGEVENPLEDKTIFLM